MRKIIKRASKIPSETLRCANANLARLREEARKMPVPETQHHVGLVRYRPSGRPCP